MKDSFLGVAMIMMYFIGVYTEVSRITESAT